MPSFGLTCPNDIKRYADKAKNYTEITWPPVVATDNSGITPNVTITGVESIYYKGNHEIVYNATDEAGNYKICKFYVTVEGKLHEIHCHLKYLLTFESIPQQACFQNFVVSKTSKINTTVEIL